jgi:AcrR family transcriptional regulator
MPTAEHGRLTVDSPEGGSDTPKDSAGSTHGSSSSGARGRSSARTGKAIAPLYKRLPKGPHGMPMEDVVHHQRIRMHGAMIEAIAAHGYERTSVKHVIGLAGVSRRAFYEQFTNKENCFMETFDLIVNRAIQRLNGACRGRTGTREQRLRAALKALAEEIETNPKALSLVLSDALTAGPEGQLRVRRALAACEQLLANGFATPPAKGRLPGPLVRAAAGGLRRATFVRLRGWDNRGRTALSGEMLRWTLLFTPPATATLRMRAISRPPLPRVVQLRGASAPTQAPSPAHMPSRQPAPASSRQPSSAHTSSPALASSRPPAPASSRQPSSAHTSSPALASSRPPAPASSRPPARGASRQPPRELLLDAVIDLVLREPYEELSAPHIAEEAGLSIDAFLALFESPQECFEAALDMLGGELLETVAHPDLVSERWPEAVCEAVERLGTHLVRNPAVAVMLGAKTFSAGMDAIEEMVRLSEEVATLLTEGATRRARGKLTVEMIAGALSHTLHSEVLAGRAHLLESLSEYMSYVVLAPYLGPDEAVRTIVLMRRKREAEEARRRDMPAASHREEHTARQAGTRGAQAELAAPDPAAPDPATPDQAAPDTNTRERLTTPVGAPLGEVREHDANEQRDDDHDDQRRVAGAENPVDLDLFKVQDSEQRDQDGEHDPGAGARQLTP